MGIFIRNIKATDSTLLCVCTFENIEEEGIFYNRKYLLPLINVTAEIQLLEQEH